MKGTSIACSTTTKPSDIILKFLEEIVESWNNGRYQKLIEQCVALLKRKKTIANLCLTVPLQRILLQGWLHQDQYDNVLEWDSSSTTTNSSLSSKRGGCEDLVMYARYRTGNYASVSKQSFHGDDDDNDNKAMYRNLHAQSEFHLNRTEDALATYQDLLSNINDDDVESKTEVLTNALAVIAASACTPTVKLGINDNKDTDDIVYKFWIDEAEMILSHGDGDVDFFADLASNLGCIQFITDPTLATNNWLEVAAAAAITSNNGGDSNKNGEVEKINLQWSKHFWYKDVEDVRYDSVSLSNNNNKHSQMSVPQSVARVNSSLLNEKIDRLPPQPHPKWNLLQVRMYWYDRAILQLRAEKYVECHDSCQSLKKTLASSSGSGGKKKKKNKADDRNTNNLNKDLSSSPMRLWWESRADVILAYVQQAQSKYKEASARLNESLDNIKEASNSSSSSPSVVSDHAFAHVLLHRFVLEQQQQQGSAGKKLKEQERQQRELLKVLKSLPESIQACPAVQLMLDNLAATVVDSNGNENRKKNTPKSPLEVADHLFGQAQYEDACKLYEGVLSSSPGYCDSQLRYVQALAMSGQHEASQALWESLESTLSLEDNTSMKRSIAPLPDGSALEIKTLPRGTASRSTSINKKIEANNSAAADNQNEEADKPSREKNIRRRARNREGYLKELEKKGLYNPDRPAKPDPERWIPKHERSRSRRGRNNNGNSRSAQGGGSNLDAQRLGLDAAARRAGKIPTSSGPSTASMKVSSSARKGGRRR